MLEPRFRHLAIHARYAAGRLPNGRFVVLMPRVASTSMGQWFRRAGVKACYPIDARGEVATFVREPLDRLVSAYEFWRTEVTFAEFVGALPQLREDVHVRPQVELVPEPAFVGRYESLAADWRSFCAWGGLEHSPLAERLNCSARDAAATYYADERVRRAAADFYSDDLRAFGYSLEAAA